MYDFLGEKREDYTSLPTNLVNHKASLTKHHQLWDMTLWVTNQREHNNRMKQARGPQ